MWGVGISMRSYPMDEITVDFIAGRFRTIFANVDSAAQSYFWYNTRVGRRRYTWGQTPQYYPFR